VRILIAEKFWEGCRGQEITDEVKVTIAAHAGILTLGFEDFYFDEVKTILVYPGGFLVEDFGEEEEELERLRHATGLAAAGGPILLSWWNVRWDGRSFGTSNVVLHEFAHALGQRFDPHDAVPVPADPKQVKQWRKVIDQEFRRLREHADYGRETLLDPYGAENLAEFFAVATETFFLQPREMREQHAKLYEALSGWFHQDPASRPLPSEADWAETKRAEDEYDEHVIAECSAAIRLHPDYTTAYLSCAGSRRQLGRLEEAVEDYTAALRLEPEDAEIFCDRGVTLRALGRTEEAITDFDQAERLAPDFARPRYERGVTHAECGDLDAALADLNTAIALDPRDDSLFLTRGRLHEERESLEEALADYSRAIKLWPRSADVFVDRAGVYLELGQVDSALADAERAVAIDPGFAEAYEVRAEVWEARGDEDRARADQATAERLRDKGPSPLGGEGLG
jgi:Mlc titration factor MtfA (ptsG expression regulator)/Tfp pilus assembly protein PilF